MAHHWKLTVWGVRGSFPRAGTGSQVYGGNTSCISAQCGDTVIALDAGSGLPFFAQSLPREHGGGRLHILLSHLHLDHVMGLFYFPPFFDADLEIHLYGLSGLKAQLSQLIRAPYWPIAFEDFPAKVVLHEFDAGAAFDIDGIRVATLPANHPNGGALYRLEQKGKSLVYALDCEVTEGYRRELCDFCRDTGLLVWDANYAGGDLRPGWGHSTWEQGIVLRRLCGAGRILMTHYNWTYTDEYLRTQEAEAARRDACCLFAREGTVIEL